MNIRCNIFYKLIFEYLEHPLDAKIELPILADYWQKSQNHKKSKNSIFCKNVLEHFFKILSGQNRDTDQIHKFSASLMYISAC